MSQEQPELPPGPARDLVDLFRVLPRARSLSGRQLAQAASVSDSYVSEIRRGLRTPGPDTAAAIAKALGADERQAAEARRLAEAQAELKRFQQKRVRPAAPPAAPGQAPPAGAEPPAGPDRHRDRSRRRLTLLGGAAVVVVALIAVAFGHHVAAQPGRDSGNQSGQGTIVVPAQPPAPAHGAGQVTSGAS